MLVSGNMLVDHKIWCKTCGTQGVWVLLLEVAIIKYNAEKSIRIETY